MKIYTKRPAHWIDHSIDKEEDKSIISEYQSGNVQKTVSNEKNIKQDIYQGVGNSPLAC